MKRKHLFLLPLLLIVSCKEISFREPQPQGRRSLSAVPEKLRGKYLTIRSDGELSRDTVVITRSGYRFGYYDKTPDSGPGRHQAGSLSDSLVLKSYRGFYFLSLDQKPGWFLRVIRQESNGDLVYMAMEGNGVDFSDYVKRLAGEIDVDSVRQDGRTVYYIDPSPQKLVDLIHKGYFSKATLKRIK